MNIHDQDTQPLYVFRTVFQACHLGNHHHCSESYQVREDGRTVTWMCICHDEDCTHKPGGDRG